MYTDPVIAKYIELLKTKCPKIKVYYQGEPTRIGESVLPCVMISKRETRIGVLTNSEDEHGIGLTLTLVADIRKDLSTADNDAKMVEGVATLYEMMEGREADYTLKADSILDVLRSNIAVDAANNLRTDLGTNTRVDYGLTLADRDTGEWRIEARVDFVASFSQIR